MIKIINGKNYKRVGKREKIKKGAYHSFGSTCNPIMREETIGMTPSNFSNKRTFWNLIENNKMCINCGSTKISKDENSSRLFCKSCETDFRKEYLEEK